MARKGPKNVDEQEDGDDAGRYSVVIDAELVPKLKIIAAALKTKVPSYVNSKLAGIIDRELEAALKEMGFDKKEK